MSSIPFTATVLGATLGALFALGQAHAQSAVRPAQAAAPSAAARAAHAAPSPSGLRPPVPAGLTSGSGAAQATLPTARSTAITTPSVVAPGSGPADALGPVDPLESADGGVNTAVLGGPPGFGVVRGPSESVPLGSPGFSAVDIARSFISADLNRDGELSRGEAARLRLAPLGFAEMDRNFDGVVSRGEYEDGLR